MSNPINNQDSLNGLFKKVYGDDIVDLVPEQFKVLNRIPFGKREALGDQYAQPVYLQLEHGVTYAGSSEDGVALNAPISGQLKEATVQGTQIILRSSLGYKAAAASMNGTDKAFKTATKFLVGNMLKSISKRLEIMLMYGQVGLTSVSSASNAVITVNSAHWAPGIWSGAENMPVEIRDITGATTRGEASISSVDFDNKTLTLNAVLAGVVSTDVLWFKGAYGKEFAGLHKIITNSGSLFGINAATYALWKGNSYDASGELSFEKIQNAVTKAVEKGLDSDVTVIINPRAWATLMSDQNALRNIDSTYKTDKSTSGSKAIEFFSQNGKLEVISSIYCKEGFAYLVSFEEMIRIGATDVTFNRPGKGGEIFFDMPSNSAYELRCYCDQALFSNAPCKNTLITGITYT